MAIHITMPALSPTMEEGTLGKWLVSEGDSIAPGDIIAEIETDKATMEVEAVDEGVISKILIDGGTQNVAVNTPIAILALDGEDPKSTDVGAAPAPVAPAAPVAAPAQKQAEAPAQSTTPSATPELKVAPTPSGERVFSSPLARRIANENGIDIAKLAGSGPRGRVIKRDVEAAIANGDTPSKTANVAGASMASGMSDDAVKALYSADSYEEKAHDGMRRAIASRLTESTQTIPSYTINMACRLDALMSTRAQINKGAPVVDEKPSYKVSVNDFIVKALALALRDVPMANASWTSDSRLLHKHSDVGVAVAIDDGLITPIVRAAELKTLTEISAEVKNLAKRARDKKLAPSEYQGGTSSVSNLGMFGVSDFTSIINPPQASIVSIGAGLKQPVVGESGELEVGIVMNATFAFDHRVIDGALGAELAGAFKNYIENPLTMLV